MGGSLACGFRGILPCYESPVHPGSDLSAWRHAYTDGGLLEGDLAAEPVAQFGRWLTQAQTAGVHEPNAMVLTTVGPQGRPSARSVLLKAFDNRGFVFYTNYGSRKAAELAANPRVALLFPWYALHRQVIVEGAAERTSEAESDRYFATRPRGSQLGAWASPQSRTVVSREPLEQAYAEQVQRYEGRDVPRPPHWGGFRVVPDVVEFWQGRPDRLHDRLRYVRDGEGWRVERLAP